MSVTFILSADQTIKKGVKPQDHIDLGFTPAQSTLDFVLNYFVEAALQTSSALHCFVQKLFQHVVPQCF